MVRQPNSRVALLAVLALGAGPALAENGTVDTSKPLPAAKVHRRTPALGSLPPTAAAHNAPEPEWRLRAKEIGTVVTVVFMASLAIGAWVTWKRKRLEPVLMFPVVATVPFSVVAPLHMAITLPESLVIMLTLAGGAFTYLGWRHVFPENDGADIHGSARWATLRDMVRAGRIQKRGFVLADSHGFALGRAPGARRSQDARFRYMGSE